MQYRLNIFPPSDIVLVVSVLFQTDNA